MTTDQGQASAGWLERLAALATTIQQGHLPVSSALIASYKDRQDHLSYQDALAADLRAALAAAQGGRGIEMRWFCRFADGTESSGWTDRADVERAIAAGLCWNDDPKNPAIAAVSYWRHAPSEWAEGEPPAASPAVPGGGGVADIATLRAGVQALIRERTDAQHPSASVYAERQRAELNALDAVMRLIDSGDWHTPPRQLPAPVPGGGLDREALVMAAAKAIRLAHGPAPDDPCCTFPDVYAARVVDALLPLLGGGS